MRRGYSPGRLVIPQVPSQVSPCAMRMYPPSPHWGPQELRMVKKVGLLPEPIL